VICDGLESESSNDENYSYFMKNNGGSSLN